MKITTSANSFYSPLFNTASTNILLKCNLPLQTFYCNMYTDIGRKRPTKPKIFHLDCFCLLTWLSIDRRR